jgi:Xaa-Pro aminopeptidase
MQRKALRGRGFCAYQEAVGHGAGLQIEFPLLCTRDEAHRMPYPDMTLKPGMVICVEAYAGEVGGGEGVKLEQQVAITPSGHEVLSALPFEEVLLNSVVPPATSRYPNQLCDAFTV